MKNPFMPLFCGDFLANCMHLTTTEVGAYFLLIAHAWEHDGCVPIADAQRIARIADNRTWARLRPRLEQFFEPVTRAGGHVLADWCSHRVTAELARAAEISNKRKGAALQMHSKRSAHAGAKPPVLHMHPDYNHLDRSVLNGKEPQPSAPPDQDAFRDKGPDYRSPPRTKSDNALARPVHEEATWNSKTTAANGPIPNYSQNKPEVSEHLMKLMLGD